MSTDDDAPGAFAIGTMPDRVDAPGAPNTAGRSAALAVARGRVNEAHLGELSRWQLERVVHFLLRGLGLPVPASFEGLTDDQLRDMVRDLNQRTT